MSELTKVELEEILRSSKQNILSFQKKADQLKGKHPRLYKEELENIKRTKSHIVYLEDRINKYDSESHEPLPSPSESYELPNPNYEKYNIELANTIDCSHEISQNEGFGQNSLRKKHYKILLAMAKNDGSLNAQDSNAKKIAQDGEFVHSGHQEYELWSPLQTQGFITQTGQALGSQSAFFRKNKSGKYVSHSKGMSGHEPTEYSIGKFELTEKGWDKVNFIVELKKKSQSKC